MIEQEFLAPVIKRSEKDPGLIRRMQNPICKACHAEYQKKYPGSPFKIICNGIPDEQDFKEASEKTGMPYEQVREVMDLQYWTERHMKVTDERGDVISFRARDYQVPILRCTANRKVNRCGRGLGKTLLSTFEELHWALNNKNFPILVVSPAKAQAKKWYDDILWAADQDPEISESIIQRLQQPFYLIRFSNGSSISIFTAGSESGRGAGSIRSQSPRRVRLEEQDGLNEADYKPIQPLFRRYKNSTVHGQSTPCGDRSFFWKMCCRFKDYKEFHVPITRHPDWGKEMEEACRREAGTYINFQHEFLAEFGDPEEGVFKARFIDASRRPYYYKDCKHVPGRAYFLGVDWNGEGTGMRARVLEFNPEDEIRRVVDTALVSGEKSTTMDVLYTIRNLNRKWHCEEIYLDYGYGAFQAGMLREMGNPAIITSPDDLRLRFIKTVDFGANLKTNKLIPKRGRPKFLKIDEEKKATKPFMVESAVMVLENDKFKFAESDATLDSEFRAYKVKTWSLHGHANTYTGGKIGDHDLTATMLAMMAIDLKYGALSATAPVHQPVMRNVSTMTQDGMPVRARADSVTPRAEGNPDSPFTPSKQPRIVAATRQAVVVVPPRASPTSRAGRSVFPSRTRLRSPFVRAPYRGF
jgi:hypothetical protein